MFHAEEEKKIIFAYEIFEKYTPNWKNEFSWMYRTNFVLAALVMPANCNQVVYVATHARFQIEIALSFVKNFNDLHDGKDEQKRIDDENFQKIVKEFLILIVKRNSRLKR
ncbi:hypothetical protein BDFB_011258 [Asbolus verrucosus]|uniref:Uncharacterized protein n=1 Tax=Asbolus verrucosus TaxID=1661398 RepID=A0A482VL53_ASBVE|nr:hypothetical protein BDFB_011258 [Asbolus verrucosus]